MERKFCDKCCLKKDEWDLIKEKFIIFLGEECTRAVTTRTLEHENIFPALQNFEKAVNTLVEMKKIRKIAVVKLLHFLSAIMLPLGYPRYHRAGNSNGKMILRLLIELSLILATPHSLIPEGVICQANGGLFRVHVSTHLSYQPSQVVEEKRTQDVLVCSVLPKCTEDALSTSLLTINFDFMPIILVADTDTTDGEAKLLEKEAQLQEDLASYKRGIGNNTVASLGVLLTNTNIKLKTADVPRYKDGKEFSLSIFSDVIKAIMEINQFLHYAVETVPSIQVLSEHIEEKKREKETAIRDTVRKTKAKKRRRMADDDDDDDYVPEEGNEDEDL